MRTIAYLLVAIALMGMASAVVDLSDNKEAVGMFEAFMQEDLVPPVETFLPNGQAWNASQSKTVGGFNYAEVSDMTNSFALGSLVRVGNLSDGEGHYLDGTKYYIQP